VEKAWLLQESKQSKHLAVVVIHRNAVALSEGESAYGSYDLYVRRISTTVPTRKSSRVCAMRW